MLISELMADELAKEFELTRNLFKRIPDDKFAWKPAENVHTVGWNAAHLVETASWVPGVLQGSEYDIAPVGCQLAPPPEPQSKEELLDAFDKRASTSLSALSGVPNSVMDEPWSLKMGGQVLFTMKKGDCLRKWVFSHSAHHRGILTAYLRIAGVEFPSIYEE